MLNVVLCDDNNEFLSYMEDIIKKIAIENEFNINIKTYLSGESVLFDLEESIHDIDIIFIDVLMGDITGIDVAAKMRELESKAQIIFITSTKAHVFDALDFMPLHYLIKEEVNEEIIKKIFMKAINLSKKNKKGIFVYKVGHEKRYKKYEDIIFFEIRNRVVNINCQGNIVEEFYSTMDNLEKQLHYKQFVRIHRSYMINIEKVLSFDGKNVLLRNGIELPVGRKYINTLRDEYADFLLKNM